MPEPSAPLDRDGEYTIRRYTEGDEADVKRLAVKGLLPGHLDHSDESTPADPHGSSAGRPTPDSFWIVESAARVVGTVALLDDQDRTGRLLQLRVARDWNADAHVSRMLVRAAVECARSRGLLKVNIESPGFASPQPGESEPSIVQYLRSLGFEYARTHEKAGRTVLEFYLNLYEQPDIGPR